MVGEAATSLGDIDAVVSSAARPITPRPIEDIDVADLRGTFEAVVVEPFQLAQRVLPAMKRRRAGAFVFVTSAREKRPEPGYAVAASVRAETTGFA